MSIVPRIAFQVRSITDPIAVATTYPYPRGKALTTAAGREGIGFCGGSAQGTHFDTMGLGTSGHAALGTGIGPVVAGAGGHGHTVTFGV